MPDKPKELGRPGSAKNYRVLFSGSEVIVHADRYDRKGDDYHFLAPRDGNPDKGYEYVATIPAKSVRAITEEQE